MRDTIYRDDAIEAVVRIINGKAYWEDILDIKDVLSALPSAEAVQGLIPCSERLPSEDGFYLIQTNWIYCNMSVYQWADGWNCYRRDDGKVGRENEIDGADIIAWMPLPKPYKGGDTE